MYVDIRVYKDTIILHHMASMEHMREIKVHVYHPGTTPETKPAKETLTCLI